MKPDLLFELVRINLVLGAAILLVLALRGPVRRYVGARLAYGLWVIPILAIAAALIPARQAEGVVRAAALNDVDSWAAGLLVEAWGAGAAVAILIVIVRQAQFLRQASRGAAGPAVTGFWSPRIIFPKGFSARFSDAERAMILAHERTHMARHDVRVNTFVAIIACLNWFNPLVHLAAHFLRMDQELACDETVLAKSHGARRTYAEALLKTQITAMPLPLGCYWPARSRHPLEARVARLGEPLAEVPASKAVTLIALLSLVVGVGAWAARPPRPAEHWYYGKLPEAQVTPNGLGVAGNIRPVATVITLAQP